MVPATPKIYLTQAGPAVRFCSLLRVALIESHRNNSLGIAKGAAYSGLLAFFPVVTTLATLLVQARAEDVAHTIANMLYEAVPPGTEDAVTRLFVVHGQQPKSLLVIATALAAFAASGAMISLMEGFQAVYHIRETRSMLRERLVAMLLVFVTAIPVLGASALIVFGARTERTLIGSLGATEFEGWVVFAGLVVRYILAFAAFVLVAALMYYFGPNRRQRISQVFPGALLATVLWIVSTFVFGWYVRNIANYNVLYGSIGGGLAMLVWMYLMAVIALLGCEFNAARERLAGTAKPA
jgi:membrane protein